MLDAPFTAVVFVGGVGIAFELAATLFRSQLIRRLCYVAMIALSSFAATILLLHDFRLLTVVMSVIVLFRILNGVRVVERRMKGLRLYHASRRTSYWLVGLQLFGFGLWQVATDFEVEITSLLYVLLAASLVMSLVFLMSAVRTLARTTFRSSDSFKSDMELPSVSVCIPARNETDDLPACLTALVNSNYPKLEILVLDDCSQDKTSEIIKGFAQDGVRFIAGEAPQPDWLAKNQAYQALAEAASGEILLFCGVDVRFGKDAIRTLTNTMLSRKKQMISVLPKSLQTKEHALLMQPMRYWWELALPRRFFNRPPVLSTVWMISRQAFFGRGEMKAVKSSILPEGYFARELTATDEYSFMRSSGKLNVSTAKRLPDQWQSAIRTRYPRLRKRPENVLMMLLAQTWLFCLPIGLFGLGYFIRLDYLWVLAGVNAILLAYTHYLIVSAWGVRQRGLAVAMFPLAVALEMFITVLSMMRYEFSKVEWKGRNVCIPVMRHYSKLPKA